MCGPGNGKVKLGGVDLSDPADLTGNRARADARAAEQRATDAEAARQKRISGNVSNINSAFAGREGQYNELGAALRERLNTQLGQKRADLTRQTKFSLARGGLTGGSAAVDAGRMLTREGQEAALGVERQAQAGVADLRARDEQSRAQLISLAQSGNDIGNAAAQSAAMLKANIGNAQNAGRLEDLGEIFGGTAGVVRAQQDAAGRRKGLSEASTYARAFSR